MIHKILAIIRQELGAYIKSVEPEEPPVGDVILGNIGLSEALNGKAKYMKDRLVLTLVNSMEEASMRNTSPLRSGDDAYSMELPPVYMSLYLLFCANYTLDEGDSKTGTREYLKATKRISQVVEFFQGKNQFSLQNSPLDEPEFMEPEYQDYKLSDDPELQNVCLNLELVSLTFEQINYLWGSLGGKQLPFVLYRAHLVPIKRRRIAERGGIIQEILTESAHIKKIIS